MAGAPTLPSTSAVIDFSEMVTRSGILAGIAVGAALLLHLVVFALLGRMARASQSETDDLVFNRISQPLRWAMAERVSPCCTETEAPLPAAPAVAALGSAGEMAVMRSILSSGGWRRALCLQS